LGSRPRCTEPTERSYSPGRPERHCRRQGRRRLPDTVFEKRNGAAPRPGGRGEGLLGRRKSRICRVSTRVFPLCTSISPAADVGSRCAIRGGPYCRTHSSTTSLPFVMAVREENPASPPRSPSARVDESFFEPTAVRDDWPEATRTTERTSARERTVQIGVELAPVGDQALRCTADAVGLSATALLRAIVLRLCREVDAGAPRLPSVLKTRMPALEGTPGATRVLRRVSLRRPDERVLRRGHSSRAGSPTSPTTSKQGPPPGRTTRLARTAAC
jgi:hypothetical protein